LLCIAWCRRFPNQEECLAHIDAVIAVGVFEERAGALRTMMPPFTNVSDVARFNLSAKMVNLSALPSPSVSSQILMSALPGSPSFTRPKG
jgi:hypothetical protein